MEEDRLTAGIKFNMLLTPYPTTHHGDRITLPVSALEQLNPQGALDLGALTFQVSTATAVTHCGVLEFTADEGKVGLPPNTARSLGLVEASPVTVKYVRLERGQHVSLQPLGDGFGEREVDFKIILERSLKVGTQSEDQA